MKVTTPRVRPQHDYAGKPWQLPVFSYGINTALKQVAYRCPEWDGQWAPAFLDGYRMRFEKAYPGSGHTYCNVRPEPGQRVFGALLWLDGDSFRSLDQFEGFPVHYQRKRVTVHVEGLGFEAAWVYHSDHLDAELPPTVDYYTGVLKGLIDIGAPGHYVEEVIRDTAHRWLHPTGEAFSPRRGSRNRPVALRR
jgi:gamma-glutamylcyclotransferase (GGCT)/AIG2-like uncharacterized protein YtfP